MAALTGFGGNVKVGSNVVALMNNWEANPTANILDKTSFGDSWKTKNAGLKDWTAKAGGKFDFTDTNGQMALYNAYLNGTPVTLNLYADGTHFWSGSAFVKTLPVKAAVDADIEIEFDFEGTGPLAYS